MLRSRRLAVVLTLEERKEQEALEKLGEARKQVDAQQQQIDDLNRYQQEYRDHIRRNQQGVVSVSRLQAWQAFVTQLDQVLHQQHKQMDALQHRFEEARKQWQAAWERRRGMEKYIESCRLQEQREQDLREQKLADEAAGRAFSRRRR